MTAVEKTQWAIEWETGPVSGTVEVTYGTLTALRPEKGAVSADCAGAQPGTFSFSATGPCRLLIEVADANLAVGARPTRVTVRASTGPFTFFGRDVWAEHPIFLPSHHAAVLRTDDTRSYAEVAAAVAQAGALSELQRIAAAPEESYSTAAPQVRDLKCQTWLGLGRDVRIFEVNPSWNDKGYWGSIRPRMQGLLMQLPEADRKQPTYEFVLGRGSGCVANIRRRLEDGYLPILFGDSQEGEVSYSMTAFASLERSPLHEDTVRGTHFLIADYHSHGHMFTPEQQAQVDELEKTEPDHSEEVVLYLRAIAANFGSTPQYAWFGAPRAEGIPRELTSYDGEAGLCLLNSGRAYAAVRLNGAPMNNAEVSVLLKPGETAEFQIAFPHSPLDRGRALALAGFDFSARHGECRDFWKKRFASGATLDLPEQRVNEMVKAGLWHLHLATYGLEPEGTLAPTIGWYSPIGSESVPIVLFFESMGRHDIARRSIQYFIDKQHDDGFVQNFGGYMVETGGFLYMIGEHYRYTRDRAWLERVRPNAEKAARYLLDWRERNKREELRGRGYGMLDGKVADPEDPLHYYMNSGYACLGLAHTAEWMEEFDPRKARELRDEAAAFREDIRAELAEDMARGPVVPLGDGTWGPTAPPWAEGAGSLSLYADGGTNFTHGTMVTRECAVGLAWLFFQQVLDPVEPTSDLLLAFYQRFFTIRNVAYCQPYYSRHDYAHLRRGEVKAFLKTWYNGFASLADRETYSWWEHYFGASPHKTHEEGWFLMQTRWMLAMEEGDTLHLLRAIPRKWLRDGQRIGIQGLATYFGAVTLEVESHVGAGDGKGATIRARWSLAEEGRGLKRLLLRLPHPKEKLAKAVQGGKYLEAEETVEVAVTGKEGEVVVMFG